MHVRYECLRYLDSDRVLDPCDHKCSQMKKNHLTTFVEEVKVMHIHKLQDNVASYEGFNAVDL